MKTTFIDCWGKNNCTYIKEDDNHSLDNYLLQFRIYVQRWFHIRIYGFIFHAFPNCSSNHLSCNQTFFLVNALHHLWNIYSKLELMPKETHLGWSHAVTFIDRDTKPAAQKPFGKFTYIM